MRVSENIFVVDGALRSACYDIDKGECWPLTSNELSVLKQLAHGRQPRGMNISGGELLKLMIAMRNRGWIKAGSPKPKNLNLSSYAGSYSSSPLNHVWLELTQSCNLKCGHCYADSGPDVIRTNELTNEQWLEVVKELIFFGVDIITFIGGEPTIRLDAAEAIAKYVRSESPNTRLRMFSNFAVSSRSFALKEFVKENDIEIGTAIYGITAESHDRMTGVKGSFEKTLQLFQEMKSDGVSVFIGMYVDLSDPRMKNQCNDWLNEIGAEKYEVIAPSQVGRGKSKSWRGAPGKNSNNKIFSFTPRQIDVSQKGHNCFFDHFAIKPNGDLSPCIMMRDVEYGSIRKYSISEILEAPEYKKAASLSKDYIDGCSDCEFRYACFDCRPDAMAGENDITKKPLCSYDPRLPLGIKLDE